MNANRSPREIRALRRTATPLRETATEAYNRKQAEALRRIALITAKLQATPDRIDWGHVGSLDEVLIQLQRAGHYAGVPELTEE